MTFVAPSPPPANKPRTLEDVDELLSPAVEIVKSPKSVELPAVAIVMYSITLELALLYVPPTAAKSPRVEEEQTPTAILAEAVDKSPKSVALPVVAVVT